MYKFLSLALGFAILYLVIQKQAEFSGRKNPVATDTKIGQELDLSTEKEEEKPEFNGTFLEKTVSSVADNMLKTRRGREFLENLIKPLETPASALDAGYAINNLNIVDSMLSTRTYGTGTKGPASCGHIVTAIYRMFDKGGKLVREESKNWQLGDRKVSVGLNSAIVGMKVGQTRQVLIPAKYAYPKFDSNNKKINHAKDLKAEIKLTTLLPDNFVNDDEVKIFDDRVAFAEPMLCGQKTSFHAKITDLTNGEVVFDSKAAKDAAEIEMRIGSQAYPMIFSYALHGKLKAAKRTVIAKGKSFKGLLVGKSKIFPEKQLDENRYFMLELD